jgi:CRP/FNR family transcriptional regulator, cyclic AMP receptor protein
MFNKQQQSQSVQRAATTSSAPISQPECIELLAHIPLFCELSRRELHKLASAAIQRDYPAGTIIVHQGEPGVGLYVIISGRARVQQRLTDGSDRELALLGGGDIFGEMALLDISPRSASVLAQEETKAMIIPIFDFRALLHDDADIAIKLLAVLARRVRTAESAASS